jgi:hypothetical protein
MNAAHERAVLDAIERSAIAGAIERVGTRLWRNAQHSFLLASMAAAFRAASGRPGVSILAAVLTHVMLMSLVARPSFWYWLIVPAIAAAAAVVLIVVERPSGPRRD